jgi:dTDP-4-dehydrorhamnose reductase
VPITVFEDVLFSPLSMPTLVQAIELVMTKRVAGTYNLGSRSGMSKADFAFRLLGAAGMAPSNVKRGSIADMQLAAPRPLDMRMSSERFETTFGLSPPELGREIDMIGGDYRDEAG